MIRILLNTRNSKLMNFLKLITLNKNGTGRTSYLTTRNVMAKMSNLCFDELNAISLMIALVHYAMHLFPIFHGMTESENPRFVVKFVKHVFPPLRIIVSLKLPNFDVLIVHTHLFLKRIVNISLCINV